MTETYTFKKETVEVIERLKSVFAVDSNAEVISRALALAQVVGRQADNHLVVVYGQGDPIKVNLTQ